ncbi:MAG: YigZ family protein [Melioribacter sp.]|uniref:IMPACT family protein n=1 Tax=Rosettibacter primus TaxID=3111523 RepID=UPI00247D8315|nr:YigZ family protein [Melioribacter sp.]
MKLPFSIKTISNFTEFRIKEKDSLFIGMSFPVSNELDATKELTKIKKKYYDATHNCYAYKLTDGTIKHSDDGEPNGTAGIRILHAINHFDLNNILVIVTRYFGGTKLGVGLLGKTYYEAAYQCLQNSQILTKILYNKLIISYNYDSLSIVHRCISKYKAVIEKNLFDEIPRIEALVPVEIKDKFINELISYIHNQIKIKEIDFFTYL